MNCRIKSIVLPLLLMIALPTQALEGGIESLRETGKAFASVARSVSPSVVFIQVEASAPARGGMPPAPFGEEWPFNDDFFRRFFGQPKPGAPRGRAPQQAPRAIGQGSGFIFRTDKGLLSKKSYILTNNHVVQNADKIRVKLSGGREFDATVTGRDALSDVAVIEIKAASLPALPLGDSSKLQVGEWVVAIGNPFGLSNTLTVGVVSATGRTGLGINDYEDFIQTDAAINPGNSGGPLVNLDGEVVGINTAIFSRSGGYMGVGFAIPINMAKRIANQLIEKGEVTRGFLGVVIQPLTPDLATSFGLEQQKGVLIAQVSEESPAAAAGLQQGDVVVAYDGRPVTDPGDFRNRVSLTAPGSRKELTIIRNGEKETVTVTIGKLSDDKVVAQGPAHSAQEIGLTVQTLTPELAQRYGARPGHGVIVSQVSPGSIAAMAGIQPGTIILQVDRKAVNNAKEFNQAVKEGSGDKRLVLLIRMGNMQRYIALRW
jgi:serine protease Do